MYSSISKNKRNTVIIFTVFITIISGIGLFFAWEFKELSIFWITLVVALVYALIDYVVATKMVIKMAGATEISRSMAPELYAAVDAITVTAGLPMPKVYIINDNAPNAFAAGTKPENAIICVTTGLLEIMDKAELEGVIAHEVGHIKNYDIRVSMAAVALTAAIGFIADIILRITFYSSDKEERSPAMFVGGLVAAIVAPILALIVRMAISREREYLADATAVMLTRYPDGLISALDKLQKYGAPMQKQNSTTASLYINNPLKKSVLNSLFATHPPIEKRIQRLKDNSARF